MQDIKQNIAKKQNMQNHKVFKQNGDGPCKVANGTN